jgi:hypothetical protein
MQSRQAWAEGVFRRIRELEVQYGRLADRRRLALFGGGCALEDYAQFNTACLAMIDYVCGRQDPHYERALLAVDRYDAIATAPLAAELIGVVRALGQAIGAGGFLSAREAARVGVLAGLLDFADALTALGRPGAAGVVLLGVIDVHLRNVVHKHFVTVEGKATIVAVHNALAATVYPGTDAEEVGRWLAVGARSLAGTTNSALQRDTVAVALSKVRRFLERYPA